MFITNNPVFSREFRLLLRNPRLLQRLFIGWTAIACVILYLWPASGVYSSESQASRFVFKSFAFGQLAMLLMLSPSVSAPLITEEKEKERFGMLFASLLTPMDILLGKWLGSLSALLLVLASGLPLLMLTIALGGVSLVEIGQVYIILLLTVLEFGFLGLMFSCLKKRTYSSIMSSYAWMLVLVAATWLPSYLLGGFRSLSLYFLLLRSLSPFSAMMDVVSPQYLIVLGRLPRSWQASELWTPDLLCFMAGALLLSAAFFLVCWRKVQMLPLGADVTSEIKEEEAKKKRFPYYLFNPDRRRSPFSVSNLIFTKELRCKLFGYLGNLIRGIYIGFGVSMILIILVCVNIRTLSLESARLTAVLFQMLIILLMTPALTASTVADEYTTGTMEMLRLTPVSSWQFFRGKFMAGILYMFILLASSCPVYVLFLVMEIMLDGNPLMVLDIVIVQVIFLVFCATCGVWCSSLLLNTQKATGMAYTVLLLITGLPFALPAMLPKGSLLDCLLAVSAFVVCIRQASIDTFKQYDVYLPYFLWMGTLTMLMAAHSMIRVGRMMRQAS